ncbi:MAG: HAD hydrolase family protein [Bacilli bacterium]
MTILVSDFDKTFFSSNYNSNIRAINDFVLKGNMFIIATGRNITDLLEEISLVDIKYEYLICNDGGAIYNKNLECLYRIDIDSSLGHLICNILNKDDNITDIFIDNGYRLVNNCDNINAIVCHYKDKRKALLGLANIMASFPLIHGYVSDNWINITNILVSKGNGIKILQTMFGFKKSDIVTVGDNINDVSMNKLFRGYMIASGHDDLKKVSVGIVASVQQLIEIIDK